MAAPQAATEWLSRRPEVEWLELDSTKAPGSTRLHNWRASAALQSGVALTTGNTGAADPFLVQGPALSEIHPLWGAGLNGNGQLLGMGDSGIGTSTIPCQCILPNPPPPTFPFSLIPQGCFPPYFCGGHLLPLPVAFLNGLVVRRHPLISGARDLNKGPLPPLLPRCPPTLPADMSSCYFRDDEVPFTPTNKGARGEDAGIWEDSRHRKVRSKAPPNVRNSLLNQCFLRTSAAAPKGCDTDLRFCSSDDIISEKIASESSSIHSSRARDFL